MNKGQNTTKNQQKRGEMTKIQNDLCRNTSFILQKSKTNTCASLKICRSGSFTSLFICSGLNLLISLSSCSVFSLVWFLSAQSKASTRLLDISVRLYPLWGDVICLQNELWMILRDFQLSVHQRTCQPITYDPVKPCVGVGLIWSGSACLRTSARVMTRIYKNKKNQTNEREKKTVLHGTEIKVSIWH